MMMMMMISSQLIRKSSSSALYTGSRVTGAAVEFSDRKKVNRPSYMKSKVMTTIDSPLTAVPITAISGDGIGPEMVECVMEILDHAGAPIVWEKFNYSSAALTKSLEHAKLAGLEPNPNMVPPELLKSMKRSKVGFRGALYTPLWGGHKSLGFLISKALGLYAHVVHCKSLPGIVTRHSNIDMVLIREYTEGLHLGLEHEVVDGVVESLNISTQPASAKIIRYAFEFALRTERKKVTCVHKANILKLTDGGFLNTFNEIASEYPSIQANNLIVDNTCMQMVSKPQQFDVLVMPNLYGAILGNLAAGLVGGVGVCPGWTAGDDIVMFEQGNRHAAHTLAGKNIANPTAVLLSAVVMLRHMNLSTSADIVEHALMKVLSEGKVLTTDLGGKATQSEFMNAVIEALQVDKITDNPRIIH